MKLKLSMMFAALFLCIGTALAQVEVKGTVVSTEDGQPIVGATVKIAKETKGVITDFDGNFTISVPKEGTMLEFSFVGMESRTVKASKNMKVSLSPDEELLSEVVVTGYGTAKKITNVTGAVSVVSSKKLEKVSTANFTDALAGQVSGLSVLTSSGDPSKSASIRLRGISSIQAGITPLFILDGAPITSAVFNTLNPGDIENITVLKDAASTAIYGSRAANGVIVITSKRGAFEQKPSITIRGQVGFSKMVDDKQQMMNSNEYIKYRELIGQPLDKSVVDIVNKNNINTNWRDEIFNSSAPTYTLDGSIRGGSQNTNYYISFNHHDQQGIISQSGMRREALRINLDSRITKWLKIGTRSNIGYTKYQHNSEAESSDIYTSNPMVQARMAMPIDSPYYYTVDEAGKATFGDKSQYLHYSQLLTPWYVCETRKYVKDMITAQLMTYEEISPVKGLTLRSQQALDWYDYTNHYTGYNVPEFYTPMGDKVTESPAGRGETFQRYYQWTITNTIEYKATFGLHNLNLLAGQESITYKTHNFGVYTEGHTDNRMLRLDQGTQVAMDDVSEGIDETVSNSWFVSGSYNFNNKYYLDVTWRTDGSSKFAPGHRWANFWSIGAMWDMKKEKFLKNVSWLDALAIKGSHGTTGNSSIGNYAYFGIISSGSLYNGENSIGIAQAPNYELTWETVHNTNIGFSTRLFNRLSVNFDFYIKKTTDMLMSVPYSMTTGHSSGAANIAEMSNKGFDLDLRLDIYRDKDWYAAVHGNVNYNKNEIQKLFNGLDELTLLDYGLQYKKGHAVGEFYMVRRVGVDPRDGKQIWLDANDNETKEYNEEAMSVLLGKNRYAPWSGGFGAEVAWKGLSVRADFAWQADKWLMSNDRYFIENNNFGTSFNQTTAMLNTWTTPGQVTDIPKVGEATQFDDHLLEDASFCRLKNLTVQYQMPAHVLAHTKFIQGCNFFFIGRNLWTITKYTGFDPEPDTNLVKFNYPNTKQFVFGLELTF